MQGVLMVALALSLGAHKPRIAVLDVQDVSGDQAAHARLLTQIITGELSRDGSLEVVSSTQIRDMLGFERQKQLLGCSEGACLAEIGGALGVDYLLSAQLGKIGSRFRLDLTLLDQKRARPAANVGDFLPAQEDALADATVKMVNQILVKGGLRDAAQAALVAQASAPAEVSHTGAYVSFGAAAALLAGAGVMTSITHSTYQSAISDYETQPNVQSSHGSRLAWMGPLTDALWIGAVGAAGLGTYLYLSAAPTGSGGEVGLRGSF